MNRTTTATASKSTNKNSQPESAADMVDSAKDRLSNVASSAAESAKEYGAHFVAEPAKDLFGLLQDYAQSKPDIAAMWCFGLGVIVGWKLRP